MNFDQELHAYRQRVNGSPADDPDEPCDHADTSAQPDGRYYCHGCGETLTHEEVYEYE